MAEYRFSRRAGLDLEAIAQYTIERFGIDQARQYRDELRACFERLADNPGLGRRAEQLAPGLRRYEHRSHIVFYQEINREINQEIDRDILIVRVLHYRMDVRRHL